MYMYMQNQNICWTFENTWLRIGWKLSNFSDWVFVHPRVWRKTNLFSVVWVLGLVKSNRKDCFPFDKCVRQRLNYTPDEIHFQKCNLCLAQTLSICEGNLPHFPWWSETPCIEGLMLNPAVCWGSCYYLLHTIRFNMSSHSLSLSNRGSGNSCLTSSHHAALFVRSD